MKKTDLIKVIREIVKQEIKKELPNALAQVFSQMMGQANRPELHSINTVRPVPASQPPVPVPEDPVDEMASLKSQLQEMFNHGGSPVQRAKPPIQPQPVQYTKNPIYNEILNQTRGFNSSERMAMRVGGGGGLSMAPGVALAASQFSPPTTPQSSPGIGEMMSDTELGFLKNVPGMPGADAPVISHIPVSRVQLKEGQEGGPAPMEALGERSALDFKNHPQLPDSIKGILNRDYRSLVRAMDKKK